MPTPELLLQSLSTGLFAIGMVILHNFNSKIDTVNKSIIELNMSIYKQELTEVLVELRCDKKCRHTKIKRNKEKLFVKTLKKGACFTIF